MIFMAERTDTQVQVRSHESHITHVRTGVSSHESEVKVTSHKSWTQVTSHESYKLKWTGDWPEEHIVISFVKATEITRWTSKQSGMGPVKNLTTHLLIHQAKKEQMWKYTTL